MAVSKRRLAEYLIAFAVVLLATLARWLLDPLMKERGPFLTYFIAVGVAGWIGGAGPGLVALILGGLAADYFFIPPRGTLGVTKVESQIGMGLYFFTGSILVGLSETQRRARASAERSARQAIERQVQLEAEIARREQVERERETLLAEQVHLRAIAEEQSATVASLFEQSPIGIVHLDNDLRHQKVNGQAAALINRLPGDMIGLTLAEAHQGKVPDDELVELLRLYRQTLETGQPFTAKAWLSSIARADGSNVYVDWSLRRIERPEGGILGVLGTYIDVTEEVEQGRALRKSEELFRLAGEAVDGLIYDADIKTGRVERTRGMLGLLGYEPEEVPPTVDWWVAQIHPEDLSRMFASIERLDAGWTRLNNEYRVRHRNGHYLHVMDRSLSQTDENGQVIRLVGCTQDITEIRQAEQSLIEADRRKDEFLAVLAHEIRNPLASIRNSLRLMRPSANGQGPAAETERDRSMAERQVEHLARLIDDLMDVSRIGQGLIELRPQPIELKTVLNRAIEATRSPLEERNHHLELCLPDRPIALEADSTRIEQVFGNLLTNAIKYTSPGGLIRVSVEVVDDESEVAIKVSDNGLGIEPEMLPKIFGMFVQEVKNLGHAQGGLGIGLGLSRNLVELHGGRITATSEGPGKGSEFEVRLPIPATIESIGNQESPKGQAPPEVPKSRKRILVVDDNEDIAISLSRVLSRIFGQDVRIAHDGPSALKLADEFHPEIILLDIGLPEMDGCEVARRLRQKPEFSETLLVALTGWGQEADRRRSEEAGIDRHLVKPVDLDALGALIAGAAKG
jgi:PAS domain S-box-containing protein